MTEEQGRRIEAQLADLEQTARQLLLNIQSLNQELRGSRTPPYSAKRVFGIPEFARIPHHAWISRVPDTVLMVAFLVAIVLPFTALKFHWQSGQSLGENRALAPPVAIGKEPLDALPTKLDAYFKDHFGFRKQLIHWQSVIQYKWLGVSDGRVIVGKNHWVFLATDHLLEDFLGLSPFKPEELKAWKEYLETRHYQLASRGVRYLFVIAPDKWSIYPEMLPASFRGAAGRPRLDQLLEFLKAAKSPVEILDLRSALIGAKPQGDLFFAQDAHWNGRGYLVAYQAICRRLENWFPEIQPQSLGKDYEIKSISWPGGDWSEVGLGEENLAYQSQFAYAKGTQTAKQVPVDVPPGTIPPLPEWYQPLEMVQPNAAHRLLFLHDSYLRSAFADHNEFPFSQHFADSLYVGMCTLSLHSLLAIVDHKHPDVVIEEKVQRYINGTPPLQTAEAAFTQLGRPLPDSTLKIAGAWVQDSYFKGPGGPGAPPFDGRIFGSYPDAGTGSIRLGPFHLDGHTGIAIPLVTGPDNHNLSVVVRDAVSQEVFAQMAPPPIRGDWWAWRPNLPQGREITIEVFAEDKGSGWGQWMALGWPHVVRQ